MSTSQDILDQILNLLTQLDIKELKIVENEARDLRQQNKLIQEETRIAEEIQKSIEKWVKISNGKPLVDTYKELSIEDRWLFSRIEFINNDDYCPGEEPDVRCDYKYCEWKDSGGYAGGTYDGTGYVWFLDSDFVICHVCLENCLKSIEKRLYSRMIKFCDNFK